MPVFLSKDLISDWIENYDIPIDAIINSIETKDIKIYTVSKAVNNGRTDHEGLIDEMKTLL